MEILLESLAQFPLPFLHGLGDFLGVLLNIIPNRRRMRARANIAACLPELSQQQQSRLVRSALRSLGRTTMETPRLWFGPEKSVRKMFRLIEGRELLEQARAHGKGVILLAPHLNWEAAVLFTGLQGPSTFLYKPQKPSVEQLMREGRGRFGTDFVRAVPGAVRQQLEQKLAEGHLLLILPDQDPPRGRGVYAPFFGVNAHTPTLVTRLARSTAAPVLLLQAQRLGSRGFDIRILSPPGNIDAQDKTLGATAVNRAMEICIEPLAGQYMWNVPRFRHRPEGEPHIYSYKG